MNAHHIEVDQARISSELESRVPGLITQTAGTVTSIVSHGFLIAFFVVFLLVGRNPHHRRTGIYADIESTIRGYITTMTVLSAITALLVGLVLWAFGLHMAWLFGLLVFVLSFIPNVGPIIATFVAGADCVHAISGSVDDSGDRGRARRDPHGDRQFCGAAN